jgi:hypothetical protein
VQPAGAAFFGLIIEQALIGYLPRGFAPTFGHGKSRYWSDAVPGLSERIERLAKSKSEGAYDARCDHGYTGSGTFSVPSGSFEHFRQKNWTRDFLLLS